MINNCTTSSFVNGGNLTGGLVGRNDGIIRQSSATGFISGINFIGGLVGSNWGYIEHCYATGDVSGITGVGGLIGCNSHAITDCYSTGSASGDKEIGALAGYNQSTITRSYAVGEVTGTQDIGGLVGLQEYHGKALMSFWDLQVSGLDQSAGGTGLTTTEMMTATPYLEAGWDFVGEDENGTRETWWIVEGQDYPRLWWESGQTD